MKHTEAAEYVKTEVGRYFVIPFITQYKGSPKHKNAIIRDPVKKNKEALSL